MPSSGKSKPENVHLFGGRLCLDFANTVDWSSTGDPIKDDVLPEPDALARWGRRLGVLAARPEVDWAELRAARSLRAALYETFAAVAAGNDPPPAALESVAGDHAQAAAAARLAFGDGAWRLEWEPDDQRRVRFAVAVDAVALLADPERLPRVRRCPGHDCGWLFLDTSGRRRWCSMQTCGSRTKMRRLYARQRVGSPDGHGHAGGAGG